MTTVMPRLVPAEVRIVLEIADSIAEVSRSFHPTSDSPRRDAAANLTALAHLYKRFCTAMRMSPPAPVEP